MKTPDGKGLFEKQAMKTYSYGAQEELWSSTLPNTMLVFGLNH